MNLESCIALIMGRRWLTVLLSLLFMLVLAAGAMFIVNVDVDVRNHFSKNDPHIVALEQLEDTYALSDVALVTVAPRNGTVFTREALVAIEDLTERLWQTPYVTRVDSIANYSHSEGREDELIVERLIDGAGSLGDSDIVNRRTWHCGAHTLINSQETCFVTGLVTARQMGADYPFRDSEARKWFNFYGRTMYGWRFRKA